MSEWREMELGELIEVVHGFAFKGEYFSDSGTDVLLTPRNFLAEGGLDVRPARCKYYVGPVGEKYVLEAGDVVVAMTDLKQSAPILGSAGTIPKHGRYLHNQRIGKVVVTNPGDLDVSFVPWILNSPPVRTGVRATATGATVRHTAPDRIVEIVVNLPCRSDQRRIASVLEAFDELIEINERRIEVLEDLARSLYREWFVRFRFPGYEQVDLVDSELGPIPVGWETRDLGSAARWFSGGTPSTTNVAYWDGDIPWITSGSLKSMLLDTSERRLTAAGVAAGSRLVDRDALLFVVRGMSLVREFRVGLADRPLAFGQDCKALVANDGIDPLFLAFTVFDRQQDIQGMVELAGHGTGKLSTDRVKAVTFPLPPASLQVAFASIIRPKRELMSTLTAETRKLIATRDLLLPRLVTGRLDISELDLGALLPSEVA